MSIAAIHLSAIDQASQIGRCCFPFVEDFLKHSDSEGSYENSIWITMRALLLIIWSSCNKSYTLTLIINVIRAITNRSCFLSKYAPSASVFMHCIIFTNKGLTIREERIVNIALEKMLLYVHLGRPRSAESCEEHRHRPPRLVGV